MSQTLEALSDEISHLMAQRRIVGLKVITIGLVFPYICPEIIHQFADNAHWQDDPSSKDSYTTTEGISLSFQVPKDGDTSETRVTIRRDFPQTNIH